MTTSITVIVLVGVMIVAVSALEEHTDGKDHTELPKEENKLPTPHTYGQSESESIKDDLYSLLEQHKRFGVILGRGFSFGKRHRLNEYDSSEDRDNENDDNSNVEHYHNGHPKRSKRFAPYSNMLGKGLAFGKGHDYDRLMDSEESDADDVDGHEIERRFYGGGILGKGYIFGKRHVPKSRLFGNILGGGFAAKRSHGFEEAHDVDYNADERSMESIEDGPEHEYFERNVDVDESNADDFKRKRYFHSSPGSRFMIGKRNGHDFNKRYGFLGRFRFGGKRFHNDIPNNYGRVLGNGFALGKRSRENESPFDSEDSFSMSDDRDNTGFDERYIGRGYMVNKRGLKRFGYVLGSGWKFGKRSAERGFLPEYDSDAFYFIDDDGNIFKLNDEESGQNGYQGDDDEDSYQFVDLLPNPEDTDMLNEQQNEKIGYVRGTGMNFGKRAASFRRFGHVLGHGFSFGK